jgi:thioredoxin
MIVTLSSAVDLKNHLQKYNVTLVDFWAPWCGPCKAMNPVLEQIAQEFQGRASIVKINIDDAPELASDHEISSIPSLKIFVNGKNVDTKVGGQAAPQLRSWLEKHMPSPTANIQHP